jgi:hypothetical protein
MLTLAARTNEFSRFVMQFLYDDVSHGHLLIHSEKRGNAFVLQVYDLNRQAVLKEEQFLSWDRYSRQYDMLRTMLPMMGR